MALACRHAVALTIAVLLLATGAWAQGLDPAKLEAARAASAQFMALAQDARQNGNPPRLADPEARPLIEAVFDGSDLAALPELPFSANKPIGERMRIGLQAALVYILAGTGVAAGREAPDDPALKPRISANIARFAPEIGLYYDLRLVVVASTLQTVVDFIAAMSPDQRRQPHVMAALAQVRNGAAEAVAGILETMSDKRMSDAWRGERLPRLMLVAPRLRGFLPGEQAQTLGEQARKAAAGLGDAGIRQGLEDFAARVSPGMVR